MNLIRHSLHKLVGLCYTGRIPVLRLLHYSLNSLGKRGLAVEVLQIQPVHVFCIYGVTVVVRPVFAPCDPAVVRGYVRSVFQVKARGGGGLDEWIRRSGAAVVEAAVNFRGLVDL